MFCKKIFEIITKKGLVNEYVILNLEDGYKFPEFVQIVPSILLTDGSLMEGQQVFEYFKNIADKIDTT